MTTPNPWPAAPRRMTEVTGAEALWLLDGAARGRLVHARREQTLVRPAVHVLAYGRLVVRAPVQADALTGRPTLTYHADEISTGEGAGAGAGVGPGAGAGAGPGAGAGWSVTVTGPAEPVDDAAEAAHYRRTLPGWTYGPHDTLLRITPQTVTGYRLGAAATL
ncbi:pyridoxamine 5'-phosphate oxidase family protein [Streptomyces sp. NPDC046203]|uniref:pyridoxamine 5'-phosphate oxidase family protein n=1 Tax=Streptomyces sp. NPDC046203 TaxID=3154602 RepID=UPI0033CDC247